ncbi:NACHT, LRR and PYD domains-containing protein 12-like [Fundulus diaphanus]
MEDRFAAGRAVDEATSQQDQNKTEGTVISAHHGSIINANHLNNVHANNITFNTSFTYVPAQTDQANVVTPKLEENIQNCQDELKCYLRSRTQTLFPGTAEESSNLSLNKTYTELYITEGGSGEVNREHEIIELECTRCTNEERKIHLNDIFKVLPNEKYLPKRVLTKGIAGIGKTVAVQKFTLDWADGKANHLFHFVFPFTFRDLNLINEKSVSLIDLICDYFEEVQDLKVSEYKRSNILFIFDGLDESKYPLNFENNAMCRSATKTTTVDVILTNLFNGQLLPNASVWITTRPAAANKIPPNHINIVTEVRGFNDEQKEEYFRKNITDKNVAQRILDHLLSKPLRSLYIMCHIPIFCWISATALQSLLSKEDQNELPKTLTEMYVHFLIKQTVLKKRKDYHGGDPDKDMVMKLGKLAFEQLEKGNIIFCEEDLKECNIDLKQAAVYSGVCTQIIRKESGLHKKEVYSFIHLSVQEFLAALYVHKTFVEHGEDLLTKRKVKVVSVAGKTPVIYLHRSAVDKALDSDYGQWDLFLRFLLGLSQDKNQELLQKVFDPKVILPQSREETIKYIHHEIEKMSYTNQGINLFHCLNELGDQSLVEQVEKFYKLGDVSKILPAHWSALAFVLLVSNDDLSVFDLKKYHGSDAVLERLLPVLKASRTALLSECNLTDRCCSNISSALTGKSGGLEVLDLSGNRLYDSGVKLLADSLKSPNCKLKELRLKQCGMTTEGCQYLARCIASNPSHLRELDLSKNTFDDEGMKLLSDVLKTCCLDTLRLKQCGITTEGCQYLARCIASNPSHLRELDLSNNTFHDEGMKLLCYVLRTCCLDTLRVSQCGLKAKGCTDLASALYSNPSYLKNLDLSWNSFNRTSVDKLSDFLKHPDCQLQRLWLSKTNLQREGAAVLVSALNPIHLKELDLGANQIGDAGVQDISALLQSPDSKIEALRLADCCFEDKGCAALLSSLLTNPAHLRVLDLEWNIIKEESVEKLSALLENRSCQLEILNLSCYFTTPDGCKHLISVLSRCSALRELILSHNPIDLDLMRDWLRKAECKLEVLRFYYVDEFTGMLLEVTLKSNPPHPRELQMNICHQTNRV